jgi:hypothetical protein
MQGANHSAFICQKSLALYPFFARIVLKMKFLDNLSLAQSFKSEYYDHQTYLKAGYAQKRGALKLETKLSDSNSKCYTRSSQYLFTLPRQSSDGLTAEPA